MSDAEDNEVLIESLAPIQQEVEGLDERRRGQ